MSAVVEVRDLSKRYGTTLAADGISFAIERGAIFGMVGPNGAGKTTTIECVEGLRRPDRGSVRVLGLDPWRERRALNRRIGVQLQESSLPPRIRVREALELFAALNPRTVDPHARRSMWELVLDVRRRGATVFLSTHFMEEAERLCDRVAIMDRGRIVALGAPGELIGEHARRTRLTLTPARPADLGRLRALPGVGAAEARDGRLEVSGEGSEFVGEALRVLSAAGIGFRDVRTTHANLEDVFLALTGRRPEPEAGPAGRPEAPPRAGRRQGAAA